MTGYPEVMSQFPVGRPSTQSRRVRRSVLPGSIIARTNGPSLEHETGTVRDRDTGRLTECTGNASEDLASFIREGIQAFCNFFETSQFDKMAQFYSSDTTLMLPHRPTIRGADILPAVFSELRAAGLRDWRIDPNGIEQTIDG
jgi:hypothetical protein